MSKKWNMLTAEWEEDGECEPLRMVPCEEVNELEELEWEDYD